MKYDIHRELKLQEALGAPIMRAACKWVLSLCTIAIVTVRIYPMLGNIIVVSETPHQFQTILI